MYELLVNTRRERVKTSLQFKNDLQKRRDFFFFERERERGREKQFNFSTENYLNYPKELQNSKLKWRKTEKKGKSGEVVQI